jgi:hypothetical protein
MREELTDERYVSGVLYSAMCDEKERRGVGTERKFGERSEVVG